MKTTTHTCEYFVDSDHAACPNPVVAYVEPKPVGQFAPAALCVHHTFMWTRDHEFHLGSEWSKMATLEDGHDCSMLAVAVMTTDTKVHNEFGDGPATITPLYNDETHEAAAADRAYKLAHLEAGFPEVAK